MNDYRRRGWIRGGTVLAVGALLLTACSGTSQTDGRLATENQGDDEETTEQNTQTDPMRTAWAVPAMKGMVEDGYQLKSDGVSTLIPTLLDYQDGPDDLLDKIKEVNDEFGKSETVQQDLASQIDQAFPTPPCKAARTKLILPLQTVQESNDKLSALNRLRINAIEKDTEWTAEQWTDYRKKVATWADATFEDEGGIEDDLKSIAQALAPKTGDGLIAICSKAAMTAWDGSPADQYANERPYYDKMLLLQSYYYNAQTTGTNLVMSANYYRARELIRPTQNPIQMRLVGEQLCGEFQDSKETPLSRREACQFAKEAMETGQTRLRNQFNLTGVGYSYNTSDDPALQNISALRPTDGNTQPKLWVKDPTQYPNEPNDTAAHARKLVNTNYAGISGWEASVTTDWKQLMNGIDPLLKKRDNLVHPTLISDVGFSGFAAYGGDGNGAVIWMGNEISNFGTGPMKAFCLFIPYSRRGNNDEGAGWPLCNRGDIRSVLLPGDEGRRTNGWLDNAVSPAGRGRFFFGPAAVVGYFGHVGGVDAFVAGEPRPDWVQFAETRNAIGWPGPTTERSVDNRQLQVIFPIKRVAQNVCTKGQGPTNVSGVARMCGADNRDWLDAVITSLAKTPAPTP